MKLYLNSTSPFSRVTLITAMLCDSESLSDFNNLHDLNNLQLEWVDPWGTAEKLIEVNPFSTIPTLSIDNNNHLVESLTICQYLINRYSPKELHNVDHQQADQVALLGFAKTLMEMAFRTAAFSRFTGEENELIERGKLALSRALIELESAHFNQDKAPVHHASTSFAHLYLYVALEYLQFRHQPIFDLYAKDNIQAFMAHSVFRGICQKISIESLNKN